MTLSFVEECSREPHLRCDPQGTILQLDARAERILGTQVGRSLHVNVVPGSEGKLKTMLSEARATSLRNWELALMAFGKPATLSFCAQPTSEASIELHAFVFMLDGETSWNFLAGVKRHPRTHDIPVLVVTVTNKEQKARALGADEFWLKPVDQDRLLRKLRSVSRPGSQAKVLVIDDDDKARYLMRKYLEREPFTLLEAATGPAGIKCAREQRPHVILLDFLLRDMTAFDVLDDLKGDPRTRGIPVVIITSHMLEASDRQRLAAETEVILSKASLSRELAIHRIRDALQKAGVSNWSNPGVPH